MRYCMLFLLFNIFCMDAFCQKGDWKGLYNVADSIKVTGFYAEVKVTDTNSKRRGSWIIANKTAVGLDIIKGEKNIGFRLFEDKNNHVVSGNDVNLSNFQYKWKYAWKENETYPLLIMSASDSATNRTLYSGYIFLPTEKKWKFIATRRYDDTTTIKYTVIQRRKKNGATFTNRWLQRSNATWKALDSQTTKPPALRHMSNIDSLFQQKTEEDLLRSKLPKDSITYEDGVFYQSLKEGTGRLVNVSDTLTVHYKGSLFNDGSIFDQTKQKPATFPLERLIKGWQIGLSHCKVGGKMRLYICSGSAYGIRTRSATIPPNSILVFDVEVLDAKEKISK